MEELKLPSRLFIDTSAFIALADRSETCHERAVLFAAEIPATTKLITSNFILDESVTRLRVLMGVTAAYRLGREILTSGRYTVVAIDPEVSLKALEKMKKYADKRLSFTDCTSFVVMENLKLQDAFAFDDDFVRVGLRAHPL